jgi:hypothetical protein
MPKAFTKTATISMEFYKLGVLFFEILSKSRSSILLDIIPYHSDAALIKPALVT